jgi:hypothetical protein
MMFLSLQPPWGSVNSSPARVYTVFNTIGWWIKERYRSMRGYKVPENAVWLSRFLAWCGNFLNRGGANLACCIF